MKIKSKEWKWTREPKDCSITDEKIEIITAPHTDCGRELTIISGTTMRQFFR